MENEVIKTANGYFSIKNLPTKLELEQYYSRKYYQDEFSQNSSIYSKDELLHSKNIAKVALHIYEKFTQNKENKLLDVGAGKGFFAKYFFEKNWNVRTLDFSEFAIKEYNPKLLNTLIQGDIYKNLDELILQKEKYNLINLSNVLEHVLDPIDLLSKFKALLSKESLLRISVPNDYSKFQEFLLEKKLYNDAHLCVIHHTWKCRCRHPQKEGGMTMADCHTFLSCQGNLSPPDYDYVCCLVGQVSLNRT